MKKFMKYMAAVALFCGVSTVAMAQDNKEDFYPNWFVGAQGGAQVTFTNYKFGKLITPQFAVQFGRWFSPEFGARFHVMGWQTKSGFPAGQIAEFGYETPEQTYTFKALTGDMDFMFNMTNICWPNRSSQRFNWNLIAGWGVNYSWDYSDYEDAIEWYGPYYSNQVRGSKNLTFNGRLATQFEYNFSRELGVNLEVQANYKNDLYNLKVDNKLDWQVCALVGVTYHFGMKEKAKPALVAEPVFATRIDTTWYDETQYKDVPAPEEMRRDIHWGIRQSSPVEQAKINEIAEFVRTHKDVKVTVTGYADKGTGNPKINIGYSQKRATAVADALREAGVPADIMTVEWKGDTVQPFAENDENRVAITVAAGMGTKKEPYTVKKFRTQEVRYQVQ